MKSATACAIVFAVAVLASCGGSDTPACPGCPLSVTISPTASPSAPVTPTPTPTPTFTTQRAIPVPTPSPTPMACVGTATPCVNFGDQLSCNQAVGCAYQEAGCTPYICTDIMDGVTCARANCSWDLVCTGSPASCYSMTNSAACGHQAGCTWVNNGCVGTATPCPYLEENVATCDNQAGCGVASGCTPIGAVQSACNQITDTNQCAATTGCYWATAQCAGTPQPCANFSDASFCTANAGCSWQAVP